MAEIADWQRKNYKKAQSFADGGAIQDVQAPPEQLRLTEEERMKQEEARDLSTIKDVDLKGKSERKPIPTPSAIPAGTIKVVDDDYQMPTPYREEGRYTARIYAAAGLKDGGYVKGKC